MLKELENAERLLKESDKNLEWGRKWSISFSSFLESSEWLGKRQRNSTISAAPEEEQSVLDVRRPQSHRSRDRIRSMTLRLLGKFFHDTTTFHEIICPFSSVVVVLEKATAQSWKK